MRYHGRGYIQLTGRANYRTYGEKLGVPLEKKPDLALRPDIAAKVLAAYVNDHGIAKLAASGDWQGVRRAVNGGLNGWDRFSTLVQGLQQAVQATTNESVGPRVSSAGFASPLRLASPTERSDRVKEAQLVPRGRQRVQAGLPRRHRRRRVGTALGSRDRAGEVLPRLPAESRRRLIRPAGLRLPHGSREAAADLCVAAGEAPEGARDRRRRQVEGGRRGAGRREEGRRRDAGEPDAVRRVVRHERCRRGAAST